MVTGLRNAIKGHSRSVQYQYEEQEHCRVGGPDVGQRDRLRYRPLEASTRSRERRSTPSESLGRGGMVASPGAGPSDRPSERWLDDVGGLVGARGFEPPTSSSRTMRATKLRHAPTVSAAEGRGMIAHPR